MNDVSKKLSERIKYERNLKGWTQEQVAQMLEVTQSGYCRWEKGGTLQGNEPDLTTLCKLAKLFEVSTDYLLGLED